SPSSKRSRSQPSADVAGGAAGERAPRHGGRVTEGISPTRLRAAFALFAVATLLLSLRVGYWQTFGRTALLVGATAQRRSELGFEPEPKRLYPNDALAAHLLGFVNDDGVGQYGVEGAYDKVLRGVPGSLVVERDAKDRELALGLRTAVAPKNGADLVLTIDLVVQTAAESALRRAIEREKATSGSIIVLDPRDGAILALASAPTFDPARVASADPEALRDRAVSWSYEPGSTMKAVTIAAGIDTGVVTPTTTYEDKGYAIIGGRRLNNAQGKVYGTTTVTQIPEPSANPGPVLRASKLGQDPLYQYLRAFGFGSPTGIDLASEASGAVRPLAQWYPVDVGTIAFGQ